MLVAWKVVQRRSRAGEAALMCVALGRSGYSHPHGYHNFTQNKYQMICSLFMYIIDCPVEWSNDNLQGATPLTQELHNECRGTVSWKQKAFDRSQQVSSTSLSASQFLQVFNRRGFEADERE